MEVLHLLIERATTCGLLTPLAESGLRHRTSIYADDVVTFLRPLQSDLRVFSQLLEDFGVVSGLRANLEKCSAHLIRCGEPEALLVAQELQCPLLPFPLRYLGLPLSLRKLTVAQLQYIVDSVASHLPRWRAGLLNRGGRLEIVKTTLSAVSIFAMMSLDLSVETLVAIEKIIRGFLWAGRKDARGGHCLVAWDRACMPKRLGGLGIPNLRLMNLALRARWLWLSRTDSSKPWAEFNIQVPRKVRQLFETATVSVVGDGASTFFWTDRWLHGGLRRVRDEAPNLFLKVPKSARCSRRVREGPAGGWLEDIPPDLDAREICELLSLADSVEGYALTGETADEFRWSLEANHQYSARSAYRAFFEGKVEMAGAQQIWRSRAPNKCKFFLWLALRKRCWTADRLGRRGWMLTLSVTRWKKTSTTCCSGVSCPGKCGPPS